MLQLLCVVLSSLKFAHALSGVHAQLGRNQPVPELGQDTYADIPGYTPPQIKKLTGMYTKLGAQELSSTHDQCSPLMQHTFAAQQHEAHLVHADLMQYIEILVQ